MTEEIPKEMRALRLHEPGISGLKVDTIPVPDPPSGFVLVRVMASPVNPSDTSFLKGTYGVSRKLPTVPGFEGSGIVVKSGGGFLGWRVLGKRVCFATQGKEDGIWAEYALVPAMNCIPIDDGTTFEQAASSFVNPLTVLGFIDTAKRGKHRAMVHTAGASALGRMLARMCQRENIPLVAVVRRQEQVDVLREQGVEHVINTSEEGWQESLSKVCTELRATIAFDAVGGELTGQVLHAMPKRSTIYVYGGLAGSPCASLIPSDFIFSSKAVKGLWLTEYLRGKNILQTLMLTSSVQKLIGTELATVYQRQCSLEEAADGINQYIRNMTAGKVLICPSRDASPAAAAGSEGTTETKDIE